jgi:4'-phosphopantetheinyl transferase
MEIIEDIRKLPALGGDAIHIWGVHVPDVLDRLEALHAVLCKKEQEKAARFHRDVDRQSSIAARGALRMLLAGYTGIPARELTFEYSENGKPFLVSQAARLLPPAQQGRRAAGGTPPAGDTVSFNVSHSGDWVVLAFGRGRTVGVDIEKIKPGMDIGPIASRYFTAEEVQQIDASADKTVAFFQLWVGKEAYVKACGSTLFRELSAFSVPAEDGEKDGWHFYRLNAGSKYAAAVVTDRPAPHMPCFDFAPLKW